MATSKSKSKKNLEKLKSLGASSDIIKSFGDKISDKELDRFINSGSQPAQAQAQSETISNPLVQTALQSTPTFKETIPTFEETYTEALQNEDAAQSKALFEPYYQGQISNVMEDLNAWVDSENVSYERTLRRGRASYASANTAIGSKRQNYEAEVTKDKETEQKNKLRETERNVGSQAVQNAGFTPYYSNKEGEIQGKMKTAVEEQNLWYKTQRQNRYNSDMSKYYQQEGSTNYITS